jgi:hypothetical protein
MKKSSTRANVLRSLFGLLLVFASALARAEDAPLAAPAQQAIGDFAAKKQALDIAIGEQKDRRNGAIAGFAIGGVVVIGGLIAAAVKAQQEADESAQNGGDGKSYQVNWIGLGIGLPILGISAYVFSDAQKQLNSLRSQRLHLSLTPTPQGMQVGLGFNF